MTKQLQLLKEADQDFEWYPTTDKMIQAVARDILYNCRECQYRTRDRQKVLDIGAGDGRVLEGIADGLQGEHHHTSVHVEKFAIEKATPHLKAMPKGVVVIGSEFHEQTLVDKKMDVIFCNPPYSEYENWIPRIIREANCRDIYLIVPRRAVERYSFKQAVTYRQANVKSLGEYDFVDAERKARCLVVLLRVRLDRSDAFDFAIESMLPELEQFDAQLKAVPELNAKMIAASADNLIESLVMAYDTERMTCMETYRDLVKIDMALLKELGVTKETVVTGLRDKISGLKDKYWKVLFDRFTPITKRLATKQRKAFLESLNGKAAIDFTEGNIYAMLIWITKWSNDYFDEQVIELYKSLASLANVTAYKSNEKVFTKGRWRYLQDENTHYRLDYRLVIEHHGGINTSSYSYEGPRGLRNAAHELLGDIITVANNLGFSCEDTTYDHDWKPSKQNAIQMEGGTLMDVRAFKNQNLHVRINQRVLLALNVEAGRLLGWLHSPQEAADELEVTGNDAAFVHGKFGTNYRIEASPLLLTGPEL